MTSTRDSFNKVLDSVRNRPGMWGLDRRLVTHCAFITGWDTAAGGALLDGFAEWLAARYDKPGAKPNSAWFGLIVRYALSRDDDGADVRFKELSEPESERFLDFLYDNLTQFLATH